MLLPISVENFAQTFSVIICVKVLVDRANECTFASKKQTTWKQIYLKQIKK